MNTSTIEKRDFVKSLEESLKEVKLYREGKIHLDTWDEYIAKKREKEKQNAV